MIRRFALLLAVLAAAAAGAFGLATAQEDDSAEKGAFTRYVEETISTPDRQISLGSIDGVLSSDVRIDTITVADRQGVWLTIENAHLVWSRLALLRGRLDIDLLEAERIVVSRPPLPAEAPATPAADEPFTVPELPVELLIDRLAAPEIVLEEPVLGERAQLAAAGGIALAGGALDAALEIQRTDERPGRLALNAEYSNETGLLDLEFALEEPENGVIATLLGIPDRPAVALTVAGTGPLDAFAAEVSLVAAGERLVSGAVTLSAVGEGAYRFVTDLDGRLRPLFPEDYAPYFEGDSTLAIEAVRRADGAVDIERAEIVSGVASLRVEGALAPDGFPVRLAVDGALGEASGEPVPLPASAGTASIRSARFSVDFGGGDETWTARFDLDGLATETLTADAAVVEAGGAARNLRDPAARAVTAEVDGALTGVLARDPALARALGDRFEILARAAWTAGRPVDVEIAEIKNPNAALHFAGLVEGLTLDGRLWLNAADVAPFAGIVGQEIAGAVTFDATGTVAAGTGAFDLTFDAGAVDLEVGVPALAPLLEGETRLTGRAARTTAGLAFEDLAVANPQVEARIDGRFASEDVALEIRATLADVGALTGRAAGPVALSAAVTGSTAVPAIVAEVTSAGLELSGRRLTEARLAFDGTVAADTAAVDGTVSLAGLLDGVRLDGRAAIESLDEGVRRIADLVFTAGGTRVAGDLAVSPEGLAAGALSVTSPDLSLVAPLALVDAAGALEAEIALSADGGSQSAEVTATARDLRVEAVSVGEAAIDLSLDDLYGVPAADGSVRASAIRIGETRIERLDATASREGETTRFSADADLAAGRLEAAGALAEVDGGYEVALDRLTLTRDPDLSARLVDPITVAVRDGAVAIPGATLAVGAGRVAVRGTAGETLDLSLAIEALPLSLADAVRPDLGLAGTLNGAVTVSGPAADPEASFDVSATGLSAAPLRQAGVPNLDLAAEGRYAAGAATVDATLRGDGLALAAAGTVPVAAAGAIDLAVTVERLPLALANAARPDLGLAGTLTGRVTVGGAVADPTADFDLAASGLSAAALQAAGVPPLEVSADGRFAGGAVSLDARATGGGLSLAASGAVPVTGGTLDLSVRGDVPLGLADRFLAERGARLSGTAAVDVTVGGTLADPAVRGTVAVEGAGFVDPESQTQLTGIGLSARLDGDTATIERLEASLAGSGRISVSGSVGIDPAGGLPADLAIEVDDARFTDGRIVTANVDARLQLTGPLLAGPALSGRVGVNRAEITIPETLPGRVTFLDVRHRLPPPNVARTMEKVRRVTEAAGDGGRGGDLVLDVVIDAPSRIFVRGRGVDAELGGSVRVTGPVSDIRPVGSFEMIRGRVVIVGQRIEFDRGTLTLVGDLDPVLDFVATTSANGITVTATIAGVASDPQVALTSVPELPQDEVLAQLLFGRSVNDLSPLQIAGLAAAVADLAGAGGGPGILGRLREATGLDDLEVVTDETGNAAVRAGRYVTENVYLGVTAGPSGQANVSVNLDITDDFKARVEVSPDGGSSVGVFYETEY